MSQVPEPKLGLKNIKDNIELSEFKNKDSFPFSGIWIYSGAQGFGKTLLMMHNLRDIHEKYPKALIVSNISIFGVPCIPYTGIEDFEKYNNGANGIIFVIDEIHTLFSSLESKYMPVSTLTVWSQNRKNRRVILGTSQRFNRVAKGLREQCTYNIECGHKFLFFYKYRVIDATLYDDMGKLDPEEDKKQHYHFYVPERRNMLMYSTLEVVNREEFKND